LSEVAHRSGAAFCSAAPLLLLALERAKEVAAVPRLGGKRRGTRQALLAEVAAAPLQLIAVALVDGEPGVSGTEARRDNEIDLHQLVANLDHVERAALQDGLAMLVFPSVACDDVPGRLLLARLPPAGILGRGAVPRPLEPFELLLGSHREATSGDVLHDRR